LININKNFYLKKIKEIITGTFTVIIIILLILPLNLLLRKIFLFLQNFLLNQKDGFLVPNGIFYSAVIPLLLLLIWGIGFLCFFLPGAIKELKNTLTLKKTLLLFLIFVIIACFLFIPINIFFAPTIFLPNKILLKNLFSTKTISINDISKMHFKEFNGLYVSCDTIYLHLKNGQKIEINIPSRWTAKVLDHIKKMYKIKLQYKKPNFIQ